MSIFNALNAGVYGRLNSTTDLTSLLAGTTAIYYLQAPDDASLPYVVFSYQASGDDNFASNHRDKNILLFVRGFTQAGQAAAGTIDARIDAALHHNPISVSGWTLFWIAREQDIPAVEIDTANVKTWMAGGYYRVRAEKD